MSQWYMAGRNALLGGDIDFDTDTIRMALAGPGFVFDDADLNLADATGLLGDAHQIVNVTAITDGRVQIGDVVFPNVGGTDPVRGLVVYHDTGDPATGTLIAAVNTRADTLPLDVTPNGGDLTFSFNYLVKI